MKFVLASSYVPFIKGGGTAIVEWLDLKLQEYGHQTETLFLPFVESMDTMLDQMLSYRLFDLTDSADRLIAFRPPAYLLRHPHKILWFIHHVRAYYDLWGSDYCGIPDTARNRAFRARLMDVDQVGLAESQTIFTNSQIVSDRLTQFNRMPSEVLYPPVLDPNQFHCSSYDPVIVCICRMENHKRQHLLVDAMRYTRSNAKLILAGQSHSGSYPRKLKLNVLKYCLQGKVQIWDRWISEHEKSQLLSTCAAAAYLPFDEDSYGYPSIEAQHACKAVLTTTDSGGVLELVQDGVNGFITEPEPQAIAAAIDRLVETNGLAERMGQAGPKRMAELGINWDHVIRQAHRMKILVVNNIVPFLRGGAEKLAENLVRNLKRYGHDADLLRIPFRWDPVERLYDEIIACRNLRLYNVDRVIGLKFPAYLIPHAHKTMWLVHQYRQAYDLAGTELSNLGDDHKSENIRQCISAADNECFAQSQAIHTISRVVKERLQHFNGFPAQVLHPPLDDAELFEPKATDNYVFCGGRINLAKRQHLMIEAIRHATSDVRLLIAGPADSPQDAQRLKDLVDRYRLHDRVQLEIAFHDRERLADWINRSLACACVPFDEDYGYVTLEAFYAGKPVLTTQDAGGVLDFVTDGETGRICQPTAQSLAEGLDELATNRDQARHWGAAARESIHERKINWPETVKRLVA